MNNQYALLTDRRFAPLFIVQFLGALNDNLFKTAVAVMVAYGLVVVEDLRTELVVSLASALFILPFVLIAPIGGALADGMDKARLIRALKLAEILIVILALTALYWQSATMMLAVIFLLGAQSALFSPAKFSIVPQHLEGRELIGGNALLNTGTYLAILGGTILGAFLALSDTGRLTIIATLLVCAAIGYAASFLIPAARAAEGHKALSCNPVAEARKNIAAAFGNPGPVMPAIFASGWFFFVAGTVLAQFPNYTRMVLGVDENVLTAFMAIFSAGIAAGGLLNNRLLRGKVSSALIPAAAAGMAIFSFDLYFASRPYLAALSMSDGALIPFASFFAEARSWRIATDLFLMAACAGLYIVPLKAMVQKLAAPALCARIVSVSAVVDALMILASAVIAMGMFAGGYGVLDVFLLMAVFTLAAAWYARSSLRPQPPAEDIALL